MARTPLNIKKLSLQALQRRYAKCRCVSQGVLNALGEDPRSGAQLLYQQLKARSAAVRKERRRLRALCAFEQGLRQQGLQYIAGVDEAGMGPLAGPVVAAAVVLPPGFVPEGIDDSKKLDAPTRTALADAIKVNAVTFAVGIAEVEEVDRLNIYHAGLTAMRRAVEKCDPRPQHLLVDGRSIPDVGLPQSKFIKGDAHHLAIAAASILAKTHRDSLMDEYDRQYPGYGFACHKGYGTPAHRAALARLGPCALHRRSFAPVNDVQVCMEFANESHDI